jgi:UDP-N-acetylglucosamine--N-acetylmuramyl-(pentapeptide) pyrophosphoryl-undecaprenol N-acetylglucosamine transferase
LLIAGGGTGGHVIPGLAVATAVVDRGRSPTSIHWMGSEIGVEVEMVPAAGYDLTVLPGRGLNSRRIDVANLKAAWGIARAAFRGAGAVRRLRPAVVLSLGGYAAVAGVIGAVLARVPVVVTEQNAVGSLANRLAGRFAKACAVPFEGTDLPKAVVTGNPVRTSIVEAAAVAIDPARRLALRHEMGVPDGATLVLAMSGSLGARSVNRAVIEMTELLADRTDLVVHHVIGKRDWNTEHAPAPRLGPAAGVTYQAVAYEQHADRLMAAADLFIGRAGGSTVSELAVVGVPSILVPLPIAPRDAQRHNAEPLVRSGGAVCVPDAQCTGARLADEVERLLADSDTLDDMARRVRSIGHPDAAELVAALLEAHARRD